MVAKIAGWLAYFAVVAALVFVGWNQPLRYRFLSQSAIYAIEHPAMPPPAVTPKPGAWMSDPARTTKLDAGPRDNLRSIYRPQGTPYPVPLR